MIRIVCFQHGKCLGIGISAHVGCKILPSTAPRTPTAAASEHSAEVVIVQILPCCVWRNRRYLHDTVIVGIAYEELSAEQKEMRVNNTIILENDAVLNMLEKPIDSRRNRRVTTNIVVKEPCFYITIPVNGSSLLFGPLDTSLCPAGNRGGDRRLLQRADSA